ncbi:hypothetical protein VTL71DRAFT_3781 [Oculimacula yallundae]|uniref:BZIP domain-containing protein n=1 Tax=Oculimacula yallundae TaxID=86028 RepID=A0ABR4C6F2_9HELO
MADETPSTQIETWLDGPTTDAGAIHSIQIDDSKLRGQRLPTSQTERDPAVNQKLPSAHAVVSDELSELILHRLDVHSEDHAFYSSRYNTFRMVNSPERNSEVRASIGGSPPKKPRGVRYDFSGSSPRSDQGKLRQDSSYYSNNEHDNESRSDGRSDSKEQRLRAREKIVLLRRKLLKTREIKRRDRVRIRRLRENVRASLDELNRKINELVALDKVPPELRPLCDTFRKAQDELGPAEYEYAELEDTLEDEEEELEEEEDLYYTVHQTSDNLEASDEASRVDATISSQDSRLDNTTSSATKPDNLSETSNESLGSEPDLLQKYLSLRDQALELRVGLQNLEDEYVGVSGDANIRRRNGFHLPAVMASFLADYVESHNEILDDIDRAEKELFDLREECLKQGVFEQNEYLYAPRDEFRDELMEVVGEALQRSPLLVSAQRIEHPEVTRNFSSKRDHVNSWLLQWVQESTIDMMMLRSWIYTLCPGISETPDKTLVQIGDDRWTDYSVSTWYRDAAGMFADANYNDSRLDVIAGDANKLNASFGDWSLSTYHSDNVGLEYKPLVDQVLIDSEIVSYATQEGDQDVNPSKTTSEKRTLSSTVLEIDTREAISEQDPNTPPAISALNHGPENRDIQIQFAEPISPTISRGFLDTQPSRHDSEELLSSENSMATTQNPEVMQSFPDLLSTSRATSVCSLRTMLDNAEPLISEESPSRLQISETPRAPNTRPAFLDIQKVPRSRSSSLTAPKRPIHHLSRRSFDSSIARITTDPIDKRSSFTND